MPAMSFSRSTTFAYVVLIAGLALVEGGRGMMKRRRSKIAAHHSLFGFAENTPEAVAAEENTPEAEGLAFSSGPKNDLTAGNKEWCASVKKVAKDKKFDEACLKEVAKQDATCRESYEFVKKTQKAAGAYEKYTFKMPFNEDCNTFKVKYAATYQAAPEVTRRIAEFTPKCEGWASKVCKNHACPKYNTMRRIIEMKDVKNTSTDLPCDEAATCTPSLPGVGPNPLVRLLNEHLLKCICVYRQDDTSVCYEGGQGIPEGKLWCEFEGMPRWREMLEKTSNRKSEEKYKEALADLPRSACAGLK